MSTYQQIINKCRRKIVKKRKINLFMRGQPFISATVLNVSVRKPKKPNSANRSVVKVRLSNGLVTFAYVPGEKHNLQPHSKVLIKASRRRDLVGIRLCVVRGAKGYDCAGVVGRKSSRSLYGTTKI